MLNTIHAELIDRHAREFSLDPLLVAAICDVESGWQTHAIRFEPAFLERYVPSTPKRFGKAISLETERMARAMSWGLMQVMGQTARELGSQHEFLSALCIPDVGIYIGCKYLGSRRDRFGSQGEDAWIAAYNSGSPRRLPGGALANQGYVTKVRAAQKRISGQ